ncbi:MAG: arsenite methyltransferase [Anaerolineae bacterium]
MTRNAIDDKQVKRKVREAYANIATRVARETGPASCCEPAPGCCGPDQVIGLAMAQRLYSPQELEGLPESVTDIALGCGNPTALAGLQPGEVVLDLGSGGGIDCFLAARQVGPTGRVIGLDMTPQMIELARENARKLGTANVEFRLGEMEAMPLEDASVDVIISNCVINLSPDKDAVFAEAFRVLKPGGRLSISDIVTRGDLPEAIRNDPQAWAACVAGALAEEVYLEKIRRAGFQGVEVVSRSYAELDEPSLGGLGRQVYSVKVRARKPAS